MNEIAKCQISLRNQETEHGGTKHIEQLLRARALKMDLRVKS